MIVGGGVAGMFSALDLAEMGIKVYLVKKDQSIGGHMIKLDKTFPTMDCSACILTSKMVEVVMDPLFSSYRFLGTHNLSLATSLKIGYDLFGDEMPSDIRIIGIEVEDIENFGKGCTPKVEAAIAPAIETVKRYLKK